ncbi:Acyltrehalose exporter MmpL10 [BD1-7 clade bacterium]|uniref:Acyltrehalose exporter MmpL10 n=1 Tax=BD1-7 clade bacterium TaxID=2029982 RepID=A0A5S9QZH6_9GAMM|nr:Acyltrehalose exporter MmpL10 [BD1-7 clade bacterium]
MTIKTRIHHNFAQLGEFIYRYPKATLIAALAIAIFCCAWLGQLRIDTSNESNLDKDHPAVKVYHDFHDQYGFEEAAVLMIKTDDLFDHNFLKKLSRLHHQLEAEVVFLDDIKSMISTDLVFGEDDDLVVENLVLSFPQDADELARFKHHALNNTLFTEGFISRSGDYTSVFMYQQAYSPELLDGKKQPFSSQEQHQFMESIRAVISEYQADDFDISIGGGPMIGNTLLSKIAFETPVFAGLSNLVILILLYILFRRVSAVLLPLMVINISLASLFGLMAMFDVALSSFSQILPSFILTVGVCDSVHFLSIFYQKYEEHQDKKRAIQEALSHTGMPMMLTSLTTAVGMLSFAFADIVPIGALGKFAAAGVMIAWFYTIVLLPSVLTLARISPTPRGKGTLVKSQQFLSRCGELGWHYPKAVTFTFGVILAAAIWSVSQLHFEHDPVKWLPEESEMPKSIKLLNDEFFGAIAVEVLLDTHQENGVKNTEMMTALEALNEMGESFSYNGVQMQSSRSVVDTLKQVHLGLNGNDPDFYSLPDSDELVAQELLLFEMSGGSELQRQVNSDFSSARVTMLGPWRDIIAYSEFVEKLEVEVRKIVGDLADVSVTGVIYLLSPVQKLAIETMAKSYISAAFVVTLMMILMIGSLRLGLLSMIPNLLPIIVGMGFMYVAGLKLDLYSILIGSIAIGLVVDDTVHFIHQFQYSFERSGDAEKAVKETLASTGNALLFTTILLFGGFMTYSLSGLINLRDFGLITGTIVVLALIADIVLLPALLRLIYHRQRQPLTDAQDKK